jgi:hypothetical protein
MLKMKELKFLATILTLFVFLIQVSCSKNDPDLTDDDQVVDEEKNEVPDETEGDPDEVPIEEPDETEVPDEIEEPDDIEVEDEEPDTEPEPEPYDPRVAPALCGMEEYQWVDDPTLGHVLENQKILNGLTTRLLLIAAKTQIEDDVKLKRIPAYDVNVYKVLYQTQDKGKLVDATGFVAVPDKTGVFPVLSILHGTVGLCDECSPTKDTSMEGPGAIAALLASFGYIVAVPDYIGLKSMGVPSEELHAYLIGEPTAIASLDMIRAVPNLLTIAGEKATAGDSIISGGSQGGHAAAFLTRLAPYYAPELNIKGAVWGIPPTDLEAHMQKALNEMISASGNTALFLLSSNEWYTNNPENYSQVFIPPFDTDLYTAASTGCDLGKEIKDIDALEDFFAQPLLESAATDPFLFEYEPWACYVRENSVVTTSIPRIDNTPAFMILSENDTLVFPDIERDSLLKLCEQGYQIQFKECAGASHSKGFLWSLDEQMDWLDARMRNEPLTNYCVLHDPVKCDSTP